MKTSMPSQIGSVGKGNSQLEAAAAWLAEAFINPVIWKTRWRLG